MADNNNNRDLGAGSGASNTKHTSVARIGSTAAATPPRTSSPHHTNSDRASSLVSLVASSASSRPRQHHQSPLYSSSSSSSLHLVLNKWDNPHKGKSALEILDEALLSLGGPVRQADVSSGNDSGGASGGVGCGATPSSLLTTRRRGEEEPTARRTNLPHVFDQGRDHGPESRKQ